MEFRDLSYFLGVHDCLSYRVAAENLNITQPALSKAVKRLELELSVILFDRDTSGTRSTNYGTLLAKHARRLLASRKHAIEAIDNLATSAPASIRIGVTPLLEVQLLPQLIKRFAAGHPKLKVNYVFGAPPDMSELLQEGNVDFVCGPLDHVNSPEIVRQVLSNSNVVAATHEDHPLARRPDVTLDDLLSYPWLVLQYRSDQFRAFWRGLGKAPPEIAAEVEAPQQYLELASTGNYIIPASEYFLIPSADKGLVRLSIKEPMWQLQIGVACLRDNQNSPELKTLVLTIDELCRRAPTIP